MRRSNGGLPCAAQRQALLHLPLVPATAPAPSCSSAGQEAPCKTLVVSYSHQYGIAVVRRAGISYGARGMHTGTGGPPLLEHNCNVASRDAQLPGARKEGCIPVPTPAGTQVWLSLVARLLPCKGCAVAHGLPCGGVRQLIARLARARVRATGVISQRGYSVVPKDKHILGIGLSLEKTHVPRQCMWGHKPFWEAGRSPPLTSILSLGAGPQPSEPISQQQAKTPRTRRRRPRTVSTFPHEREHGMFLGRGYTCEYITASTARHARAGELPCQGSVRHRTSARMGMAVSPVST